MNDCENHDPSCLRSESGAFPIDKDGVARHFFEAEGNPLIFEYHGYCRKAINSFVVPHGVKGLGSRILSEVWVREKFELPDGLVRIGSASALYGPFEFTKCDLPSVVIPPSVVVLGCYAFANCRIQRLRLPLLSLCPYARQFKGSSIELLELPAALQHAVVLDGKHLDVCGTLPGGTGVASGCGCLCSICSNAESVGGLKFY